VLDFASGHLNDALVHVFVDNDSCRHPWQTLVLHYN
jgi:hypothetical protein